MITNPTAVKFSNEHIRVAADLFARGYYRAKAAVQKYDAQQLAQHFTDAEVIDDGSAGDGRNPITGAHAKAIVEAMRGLIADFEATDNAKLMGVLAVAVNPHIG